MASSPPNDGKPDISIDEAISQAVQQNDAHTLRQLLEKRKRNPVPLPADDQGMTALHLAASRPQSKECLELLLQQGDGLVDLDARTEHFETALHIACEEGCEENVLLLLQAGCCSKLSEYELSRALGIAASNGNLKIVEYFFRYLAPKDGEQWVGMRALHNSYDKGHWEVFHLISRKAVGIQSKDNFGDLPLHDCMLFSKFDGSLLRECADLALMNHQNRMGVTPLMYAVQRLDLPTVRYLLENGVNTDIYDNEGRGVLHWAMENDSPEIFRYLLQSSDLSNYHRFCLNSFPFIGENFGRAFTSLTCSALYASRDCLDLLLTSGLPKSILQMPNIEETEFYYSVYSPLAHLFYRLYRDEDVNLIAYLHLLLDHNIIMIDEFRMEFHVEWPVDVGFNHPFEHLMEYADTDLQQQYFDLLIANGVTTDYCLQCYHDNTQPFDTFADYNTYYKQVICNLPLYFRDFEMIEQIIYNSVILEPDKLLVYIINYNRRELFPMNHVYQYLTRLKPINCIRGLLRSSNSEDKRYLCDIASEEFSRCTLQQLCRTAIRQQLREHSLGANLRNFRRKIFELPLPTSMKDYLLFKY